MALDDKAEIETGAGVTCLTLINVTADESGKYEVRIENAVGSDSKYVNVTVEGIKKNNKNKYINIPCILIKSWMCGCKFVDALFNLLIKKKRYAKGNL